MIALLAARAALGRMPIWAYGVLAGLAVVGTSYHLGRTHERKLADVEMAECKGKQVAATKVIVQKEVQVVTKTEIVYRDRLQKIYVQGAQIEVDIPKYIKPADDQLFAVNAGFVRVIDGAWSGLLDGPAQDADREPAGVPLSAIADVEVGNATSCRAWRDKVIGWRAFYAGQQGAINGKVGDWYHPPTTEEQ